MFPPGFAPTSSSVDSPLGSTSTHLSYEDKEKYSTPISSGSHLGKDEHERDDATASTLSTLPTDLPSPRIQQGPRSSRRRRLILALFITGPILLALGVGIPVGLASMKAKQLNAGSAASTKQSNGGSPQSTDSSHPVRPITGGDGSLVTMVDGSTFTYSNKFGGFWTSDPNNPTSDSARPNSWTPPLNQTWDFNTDKIYGVNLGGLFVLEPFISPGLFQKYPGAVDEWTLTTMMAEDTANGGLSQLEHHYDTFITEKDIAEIAGAGLNWVRLPIPFWAIETWPGEPFLAKTSWKYIIRLIGWCRKYGLRVNLDLHTIPGSQNGYNHSGRYGQVNFLHGTMGLANAQRALNYIRIITEFISQPEWRNVVPMFGILNEPLMPTIGINQLQSFYVEVYRIVRSITGYGTGKGPYIGFHEGFSGPDPWAGFMRGADRVVLDMHPYFAFSGGTASDPIATGTGPTAGGVWPGRACQRWDNLFSSSRANYGISVAGEWSNGWNDCGLFLNGVGFAPTFGGSCEDWENSANWDAATKAGLLHFATASMDALDSWFFWTWKIGNSTRGIVESPLWSYQLGLEGGWMPTDPRTAAGTCAALEVSLTPAPTPYPSWMTGGNGTGIPQDVDQLTWPPATILNGGPPGQLPQYTATATPTTLAPPSATGTDGKNLNFGSGWFNAQDTVLAPGPISGCDYPDAWDSTQAATISSACVPQAAQ
ncbi:hypothetical protein H1R20_g14279, partial [Candolleomyces eurysporus]